MSELACLFCLVASREPPSERISELRCYRGVGRVVPPGGGQLFTLGWLHGIAPQNLSALQEVGQKILWEVGLGALQKVEQNALQEVKLGALEEVEQNALEEVGQNLLNRCLGALWEVGTKLAYYVVGSNSS